MKCKVVQANVDTSAKYKPVDLVFESGASVRIGDNSRALKFAYALAERINAYDAMHASLSDGANAADSVVARWSHGDLASAVNSLEEWADSVREMGVFK